VSSSTFTVTDVQALYDAVDPLARDVAVLLASNTAADTPRDTGRLAAGWHVVDRPKGRFVVTNDVPYARFVEYGTKDVRPVAMLGRATAQARARYGAR
jgi:hypothetical protein